MDILHRLACSCIVIHESGLASTRWIMYNGILSGRLVHLIWVKVTELCGPWRGGGGSKPNSIRRPSTLCCPTHTDICDVGEQALRPSDHHLLYAIIFLQILLGELTGCITGEVGTRPSNDSWIVIPRFALSWSCDASLMIWMALTLRSTIIWVMDVNRSSIKQWWRIQSLC
jgi:hypothetical protein